MKKNLNSNKNESGSISYLVLVSLASALGGFLFGFDTAVASGAIGFLREQFSLTSSLEGWVMSSALYGSVFGAGIAGYLSDKYGRKRILIVAAVLFFISALGTMLPQTISVLIPARILGGVGVGIAAMVSPMFISELSPPSLRGRMVSLYQLAITMGIVSSYLSNSVLLSYANEATAGSSFVDYIFIDEVWRGMFGMEVLPAALFLIVLFFVPESPRWLAKEGQIKEAKITLLRVLGLKEMKKEINEIKQTLRIEPESIFQIFRPGLRLALIIGITLPLLSQFAGITTVMYYAPTIFEQAGFQSTSAFGTALLLGTVNMLFTVVAILKIDQFGRKPLLLFGFGGLFLTLGAIGFIFISNTNSFITGSYLLVVFFVIYIMIFAATLGPGVWVVISEIFPNKIRGRAMSIGTLCLFIGSTIVTQTFPYLRDELGIGIAFWLYMLMMIPGAIFVWYIVPETKGKTLEEIEKDWIGFNEINRFN